MSCMMGGWWAGGWLDCGGWRYVWCNAWVSWFVSVGGGPVILLFKYKITPRTIDTIILNGLLRRQ